MACVHTAASITGIDLLRSRVTFGNLEAAKWFAFVLMVIEHVTRYVIEGAGPLGYYLGRAVFPLFAIALAFGVAAKIPSERWLVVRRLLLWAALAEIARRFLYDAPALNVLVTFAIGITLHTVYSGVHRCRSLSMIALLIAACACEYGPGGALAVAFYIGAIRAQTLWCQVLAVLVATQLIVMQSDVPFAWLGPVVLAALVLMKVEVPRLRGVFYQAYAVHWAVLAAVKAVVP